MNLYDRLLRQARIGGLIEFSHENRIVQALMRRPPTTRRNPPEAGLAVPAIPPRGPQPKQGGAEAPLEFDND